MGLYTITSNDTLTIFGQVISDFADGDTSTIAFANDYVKMKTGKNQNTIYSRDESGNNCTATIRLMRGSKDDRFMKGQISLMERDFASYALAQGTFVKRLGDGQGGVTSDVYNLQGGIITRKPDTKENVEGDTAQGVSIYTIMFAIGTISVQ